MRLMIKLLLWSKNAWHFPEEGSASSTRERSTLLNRSLLMWKTFNEHIQRQQKNGAPRLCFSLPLM